MKNIFKVTFVILGTIIGAGFASGQEIGLFFNRYEQKGVIGLIFMSIILMLCIYLTFEFIIKNNINTYREFTREINE